MPPLPLEEIAPLMQFIAEKVKNVKSPMSLIGIACQFKEETGSLLSVHSLKKRIVKGRLKIHKMNGFDNDTKGKMIFALSAPIDKGFLNELKKQADVEVDEKGRITKYHSKDGSLKLEGSHGHSSIQRSMYFDRWQKVCNNDESEEEEDENSNGQKDRENKRMVRFLIEQTKNANSPLSLYTLASDYKEEFKCSESPETIRHRIIRFRQHIHKMNHFDMPTKVKMLFALSVPIDADFLQKLQKDAIVQLDKNQKIKKYKCNDASLELKGNHSMSAKVKAAKAIVKKKTRVVNDLSESEEEGNEENSNETDDSEEEEDDDDEEDSSETDGSDEKGDGDDTGNSGKSNQASTSLPSRRSQRIRKLTSSTHNNFKTKATTAQKQSAMPKGKKRARISYSSSESSEEEPPEVEGDEEKSEKSEDDFSMENVEDPNGVENPIDFDYEPPQNHPEDEDVIVVNTIPVEQKPRVGVENPQDNYPDNEQDDVMVFLSAPVEQKPQGLLTISGPVRGEEPTTSIKELLALLRGPVMAIRSPSLQRICAKFNTKIQELANGNQQMLVESLRIPLEACLFLLLKHAAPKCEPEEESIGLRDFLISLKSATCHIEHPSMESFHQKLQTKIFELSARDERIPIHIIDRAMDHTLLMLDA